MAIAPSVAVTTDIPPDLRLVLPAVGAWLGALWGLTHATSALVAAGGLLPLVVACSWPSLRRRRRRPPRGALLVLVCVSVAAAATMIAGSLRVGSLQTGPVVRLAHESAIVDVDVVLTSDPRRVRTRVIGNSRAPTQYAAQADLVQLRAYGDTLRQRLPLLVIGSGHAWASLLPGQPLHLSGRLRPADPSGGDDVAAVLSSRGPPQLTGRPSLLQRVAGHVRASLRQSVAGLPADERGLVPGLVDGDTSQLPAQTSDDFRTAGMTHLVAVSGSNVAFVLAAVLVAARFLGLRSYAVPVAGAVGLCAFTVLARPEPSVVRAALMGLLVLVSAQRGAQGRAGPATLCAAVVVLLMLDPFLARSAGFALSVLATAGLLVLAPGWRARLARRWPRPIADGVATALAAQVATLPVIVLLTPNLGLLSVPANVLAEPAVPVATVLGALVAVVGVVAPAAGVVIAHVAAAPAWWLVTVAHGTAQLPIASVGWPQGLGGAALMVLVLCGARLVAPALLRRPAACAAVGVGVLVLGWVGLPALPWQGWPPPGWLVVACDVGQGDGLVVSTAPGAAVVVDAGPDPIPIDRCLRDLGVRRVPLVLLTHFHADHVEGLPGVLRRRSVGEIEVTVLGDPPDEVRRVDSWAAQAHIPVRQVHLGEQRSVGDVTWTVLWPARVIDIDSRPNNASIVLRLVTHGVVVLLTGDVEPPAQSSILTSDPGALRADVVKVPHHGSANQDPDFLRATGAHLAIVSVGLGNPYGHPAPRTLDLLRSWGVQVERTDTAGDVAVVGTAGRAALVSRHPP